MARSPLMNLVRRAVRLARAANRADGRSVAELCAKAGPTRRSFLHAAAGGAALLVGGRYLAGCASSEVFEPRPARPGDPRIAIVGGGIAGLNAAWKLRRKGIRADVYEAARRVGGRIYTGYDVVADGITTELGGEFIDSPHAEMRRLVREFDLELIDTQDDDETPINDVFFFDGRHVSLDEVVEAFRPLVGRLRRDRAALGETISYREEGGAGQLDRTSLAEYLDQVGATGFLRRLLEVAFVTEFGLDPGEQSALNLLLIIGLEDEDEFHPFGESDERYKVRGGNERIIAELARRLPGQVLLEHRLEALASRGSGFALTFAGPNSTPVQVTADVVLLAIPFTTLRQVALEVELPEVKRRAIHELGYGQNAKLMWGFRQRVWRQRGYAGNVYSDEPFQLAWDSSRMQPGTAGALTAYVGGQAAWRLGDGTADGQGQLLLPAVERAFAGVLAAHNGRVQRFHWPTHPHSLGSYVCPRPGQWTTLIGCEGESVGNLFFAGEHCSIEFQGFMNGAAESGRLAAEAIRARARA